jgi:hypothetical protein
MYPLDEFISLVMSFLMNQSFPLSFFTLLPVLNFAKTLFYLTPLFAILNMGENLLMIHYWLILLIWLPDLFMRLYRKQGKVLIKLVELPQNSVQNSAANSSEEDIMDTESDGGSPAGSASGSQISASDQVRTELDRTVQHAGERGRVSASSIDPGEAMHREHAAAPGQDSSRSSTGQSDHAHDEEIPPVATPSSTPIPASGGASPKIRGGKR